MLLAANLQLVKKKKKEFIICKPSLYGNLFSCMFMVDSVPKP